MSCNLFSNQFDYGRHWTFLSAGGPAANHSAIQLSNGSGSSGANGRPANCSHTSPCLPSFLPAFPPHRANILKTRSVILAHQHYRPLISMTPEHKVVTNRKQHHHTINQTAPVHAFRLHRRRQRKESKNVDQQQEQHRDDVTSEPSTA
jgi:hypothetical protein